MDIKLKRAEEIEKIITKDGFWEDNQAAKHILQERSTITTVINGFTKLQAEWDEVDLLLQLAEEENDAETLTEVEERTKILGEHLAQAEFNQMLNGEYDNRNAILTIHAGAGGTEAQDWAEMLLRMYLRWAERRSLVVEMYDLQPGDEAGIKSATFSVTGDYAYGYLKAEIGIHRLVRISPFDAGSRRHTSFASIFVYPDIDEDITIDIN
ncbi:MAG: PCRF domain-containing protein, partial [Deltaproteobacteria bacterium]|nr:PCRF domain-containing protein [Deltaproteobacteria bacterium]